jgi:hypothetical protein
MQPFQCGHCRTTVFFENDRCLTCAAPLGFVPARMQLLAFAPEPEASPDAPWSPQGGDGPALRPCANRATAALCNWMLDDDEPEAQTLCRSCRLTQVLPTLDQPRNATRWQRIEQAKRRLVFTLLGLGLGPVPKRNADDAEGLSFHLLEDQPGAEPVKTGHDNGTITLNVAEADDDHREAQRVQLGEPTRSLLGHLRHETSHYLQYRWVDGRPGVASCRSAFGDERTDYAQALARHYADGPPTDWAQRFISAYASAHPWEDWAETCAHYLLVLDAVQTATTWGLRLTGPAQALPQSHDVAAAPAVSQLVVQQWLPVSQFLNAMNRSLGLGDSYPFQMPPEVLNKMGVVQQLLQTAAAAATSVAGDG